MSNNTQAKLQIRKQTADALTLLQLTGVIDESFNPAPQLRTVQGAICFSLAGVRRITSFGIRQWVECLSGLRERCSAIYFTHCPPRLMDQFNMVGGFAGGGSLLSYYLPLGCPACGAEHQQLVTVDPAAPAEHPAEEAFDTCPGCGGALELDDDPEAFFSYLAGQAPVSIEPRVAAALAAHDGLPGSVAQQGVQLRKRVSGRFSLIALTGVLDGSLPVDKIVSGLEGDLVLDLQPTVCGEQGWRESWRELLRRGAPAVERLLLLGLPSRLLEGLEREQDLAGKGQALSIMLPYHCPRCSGSGELELDVRQHHRQLRTGAAPRLTCPDCGNTGASFTGSEAMQAGLRQLPRPAADLEPARLQQLIRSPDPAAAAVAAAAQPSPDRSGPPQVSSQAPAARAQQPLPRSPRRLPLWIGAAAATLALVGLAWVASRAPSEAVGQEPAQGVVLLETSQPAAPAWRDAGVERVGQRVLVTGSSGVAASVEQGLHRARNDGLDRFCALVAQSIRATPWQVHVGRRFARIRDEALLARQLARQSNARQLGSGARERKVWTHQAQVARALLDVTPHVDHPQLVASYWEKLQVGPSVVYRVWVRLEASALATDRLATRFGAGQAVLGATVVDVFPAEAWLDNAPEGAVVTRLAAGSPLLRAGLLEGDVIKAVDGRLTRDAADAKATLQTRHRALRHTGGGLQLSVLRGSSLIPLRVQVDRHQRRVRQQPRIKERRPLDDGWNNLFENDDPYQ